MQRFADQLVDHTGPVVLRGVDVVDAVYDGLLEHGDRLCAVAWRPEHPVTCQLHGSEARPVHPPSADRKPARRLH